MTIMILDGQGGGLGRSLIDAVVKEYSTAETVAVGTNSAATAAMVKGSKIQGATGENAVAYNAARADVIIAPLGAYFANGLLGEISAAMANSLAASPAFKIAIPGAGSPVNIASHKSLSATDEIRQALALLRQRFPA